VGDPNGRTICDPTDSVCVECVGDNDCDTGEVCLGNVCRVGCTSDNDCTPLGLICDLGAGLCVDCLSDASCAANEHCASGSCAPDVCLQGSSTCDGDAVVQCSSNGDGLAQPVPCSAGETCVESGTTASCVVPGADGGTPGQDASTPPSDAGDPCSNGQLDGDESDVDCGGQDCAPCGSGLDCNAAADCASDVCVKQNPYCQFFCARVCAAPACDDGVRNGLETDVDCGGGCPGCAGGAACNVDGDCAGGTCNQDAGTCAVECQSGADCPATCAFAECCSSGSCGCLQYTGTLTCVVN
jgi:hypothetical protein